jgi:hypothetical protein
MYTHTTPTQTHTSGTYVYIQPHTSEPLSTDPLGKNTAGLTFF